MSTDTEQTAPAGEQRGLRYAVVPPTPPEGFLDMIAA